VRALNPHALPLHNSIVVTVASLPEVFNLTNPSAQEPRHLLLAGGGRCSAVPEGGYLGLSPWWLRRMIPIIFRLIAANRHSCHGMNVRVNTVNLVGFVA